MADQNKNIYVTYWLLLITLLVGIMIVVGGLTRLTDSGLSITKWDLFTGIIPPLSQENWEKSFSLYKNIPEYKVLNSSMTLPEFKFIFWWEYAHRLLGRIIGLLYLIPLIIFSIKKNILQNYLSLYFIFILIAFQGFIGWYMVQSGLTLRTDVSHYRLSLHLFIAFIIFSLLFWNFLIYKNQINNVKTNLKLPYELPSIFLFLLFVQISIGALVSGLDAGTIYPTWPLMGQTYFPDDSSFLDLYSIKALENPSLIQFIHRNVSYLIALIFLFICFLTFKNQKYFYLKKNVIYVFIALSFQIFLGIITVLSGADIYIASLHQIGSIILITTTLLMLFKNYKIN